MIGFSSETHHHMEAAVPSCVFLAAGTSTWCQCPHAAREGGPCRPSAIGNHLVSLCPSHAAIHDGPVTLDTAGSPARAAAPPSPPGWWEQRSSSSGPEAKQQLSRARFSRYAAPEFAGNARCAWRRRKPSSGSATAAPASDRCLTAATDSKAPLQFSTA